MKVITCHKSPDFDAIASSIAAKKLYPDALLVLPPLPPYTMKNFLIQTSIYLYSPKLPKELNLNDIDTLIIVDTHSKERIETFEKIAGKIKTICYDHHAEGDITNCTFYTDKVGATTTIMINELRKKNIDITPDEATLFLTGIYEDTGNLTYSSTTVKDFQACAWLLQKGGDLTLVSQILEKEMTAPQVNILNELIKNKNIHEIGNLKMGVTFASFDYYIHEAAISVEKMIKIENLDAIIAAIRMENRIYVIGRSEKKEIDISKFAKLFGGGGHSYAASATVKNITLTEVIEKIFNKLNEITLDAFTAEKIMTYPPRSIEYDQTVEEANEIMTRFSINVLPVFKSDKLIGIITRQTIQRALHHHLQHRTIEEFMTTDFKTVSFNTSFEKIRRIIIDEKQKLLPVLKRGEFIGVITRTNILHLLNKEKIRKHTLKIENINYKMKKGLPPNIYNLLKRIGSLAQQLKFNAYAVGGFVRDLILNRENLDIDIVIEENGITFAKEFAKLVKGKTATHEKFNTATVILPNKFKFDVATARQEYYEIPGSLPSIELSSIKQDLYR
ncbi:MAG: CBS domain-containing protein, partial [Deltaproteobacteria bacterium]|nr:CBS domain-containing protein [Deltaproteobacteria bacterium]